MLPTNDFFLLINLSLFFEMLFLSLFTLFPVRSPLKAILPLFLLVLFINFRQTEAFLEEILNLQKSYDYFYLALDFVSLFFVFLILLSFLNQKLKIWFFLIFLSFTLYYFLNPFEIILGTSTFVVICLTFFAVFFLFMGFFHSDEVSRELSSSLSPGFLSLSLALIIQKSLIVTPFFKPLFFSILCLYAHNKFCSIFKRYYTFEKRDFLTKLFHSLGLFLFLSYFFLFLFLIPAFIQISSFVLPGKTVILFSFSFSLFFILLSKFSENFFKYWNRFTSPNFHLLQESLRSDRESFNKILKMKDFYSLLSKIFKDILFFEKIWLILVFEEDEEEKIRLIGPQTDQFYNRSSLVNLLKKTFSNQKIGLSSEIGIRNIFPEIQRIFPSGESPKEIKAFVKIDYSGPFLVLLGIETISHLTKELLYHIQSKTSFLGNCLHNILLFEQKKNSLYHEMKENTQSINLDALQHQNRILAKTYEGINKPSEDLIEKEKMAAMTKFCISMDDEISNPLNNMLVAIQYHLEKLKLGNTIPNLDRKKLLDILVTQSLRIKSLLDKMHQLMEDSKLDNKNLTLSLDSLDL